MALILTVAGLAGAAVGIAGGVAFIGLMAPHLARMWVGPAHEQLLPVAALVGGVLLMAADLAGRTAFPPNDLPAGIFCWNGWKMCARMISAWPATSSIPPRSPWA